MLFTAHLTAQDMRLRLDRLVAERNHAYTTGLRHNDFHMEALERDLAATRDAYVGFAVTEIATMRGQLSGRQVG